MNHKHGRYGRIEQLKSFQSRMSAQAYEKAMHTNFTPTSRKVKTWAFAKLVNALMAVLELFSKRERGNMTVLGFELLALSYFVPLAETIEFSAKMVELTEKLEDVMGKLWETGLYEHPDVQHPLVLEYLGIVDEIEAFIPKVHREYRQCVTLKGAFSKSPKTRKDRICG